MAATKKYLIELPYFRSQTGVLYPPGTVVEIPATEKPSVTWKLVEESAEAPTPASAVEAALPVAAPAPTPAKESKSLKGGRASDKDAV